MRGRCNQTDLTQTPYGPSRDDGSDDSCRDDPDDGRHHHSPSRYLALVLNQPPQSDWTGERTERKEKTPVKLL